MTLPIQGVLFDMDGLLLDTETFYTEVTQEIASRYGKTFDWSLKSKVLGRKAIESARMIVEELELPITPEQYLEQRSIGLEERFAHTRALPGAPELTTHLRKHKIPQAVATSSARRLYELKIQQHQQWFEDFQIVVNGDDPEVRAGKPAPDIFLVAARRLGVSPERCLVFEDAPSGMAAAKAAGMAVVVVPDPQMDRSPYTHADEILDSLNDFAPERWGLPRRQLTP
jgi:pseudouridine-5'-monophosphatase